MINFFKKLFKRSKPAETKRECHVPDKPKTGSVLPKTSCKTTMPSVKEPAHHTVCDGYASGSRPSRRYKDTEDFVFTAVPLYSGGSSDFSGGDSGSSSSDFSGGGGESGGGGYSGDF